MLAPPETRHEDKMWEVDGSDGGELRRPTTAAMTTEGGCDGGALLPVAGTDVLGYRLPPDGSVGFWALAGTEERSFRRPPDLGCGGLDGAGTNVLRFCAPPDPEPRTGQRGYEEVLIVPGTEMCGFRVPPDGGRCVLAAAAERKHPLPDGPEFLATVFLSGVLTSM